MKGRVEDGTDGIQPFFCYGDASFSSTCFGGYSSPTTGASKSLQRVGGLANFVFIDEFRTSACCSSCGFLLHSVYTRDSSKRRDQRVKKRAAFLASRGEEEDPNKTASHEWDVRGEKICRNKACPDKHSSFKNRDINAPVNMLSRFQAMDAGLPVPAHLTRAFKFTKAQRAYVKRNRYVLPPDLDTFTFKSPHGDGGPELAAQRKELHERNAVTTGWSAPLAGKLNDTRLLLPTSPIGGLSGGSRWQTSVWPVGPLNRQTSVSAARISDPRVVDERMSMPLTATSGSSISVGQVIRTR